MSVCKAHMHIRYTAVMVWELACRKWKEHLGVVHELVQKLLVFQPGACLLLIKLCGRIHALKQNQTHPSDTSITTATNMALSRPRPGSDRNCSDTIHVGKHLTGIGMCFSLIRPHEVVWNSSSRSSCRQVFT